MPFQPTRTLTAFIMEEPLKKALESPSALGQVLFTTSTIEFFQLMLLCLDAYIKGAAVGYTFKGKSDLIFQMMIKPDSAQEYTDYLNRLAQKRIDSYSREINSIIDFFISTELSKDDLTFDGLIEKAKDKIKLQAAGPRVKLNFEEGVLLGAKYPEIVSKVMSCQHKTLAFDWEKAKLMDPSFDINTHEPDLEFLGKWAVHNVRQYANECFPEFIAPLGL